MNNKDKKRVDQDVRPELWFKNYDYAGPEKANKTSPGKGLYNGKMDKYKSVKDFIEQKRKRRRELKNAKFTSDQLLRAANKFYHLLAQKVEESDGTIVTLSVRPTVNDILTRMNFNNKVQNTVQNMVNKNNNLRGNLNVSSFVTNASLSPNGWIIDPANSGLKVDGTLANQPEIRQLISGINQALFKSVAAQFNRLTKGGSLTGNKITDHVTDISETSIDV